MAIKILAKHRRPDVISVKDNVISLSFSGSELGKNVVLFDFTGSEFFRGFEEIGDASTEHSLDADGRNGRHFGSEREKKSLLGMSLESFLEHLNLSSLVSASAFIGKVLMSALGKSNEIFAQGIEQKQDDLPIVLTLLSSRRSELKQILLLLEEGIHCELNRKHQQQESCEAAPNFMHKTHIKYNKT
jgi:hypothetical protein